MARLPDADQSRFPVSRLDPSGADCARPDSVPRLGETHAGTARVGHSGMAQLLFQVSDDGAWTLSGARLVHPADEVEKHAPPPEGRRPDHAFGAGVLRLRIVVESKRKYQDYEENVPGEFYVASDMCIACRAPEHVAQKLVGFYDDTSGPNSHCYFRKQPETEQEIAEAIKAVSVNCCGSYHYSGSDPRIKEILRANACGDALDNHYLHPYVAFNRSSHSAPTNHTTPPPTT